MVIEQGHDGVKAQEQNQSFLIRMQMQNRFAHWSDSVCRGSEQQEFKLIQGDAEHGWSLSCQRGREGRWRNVPAE